MDVSQRVANANLYLPLADAQAMAAIAPNVVAVHDMRPDDANLLFIKAEQTQAEAVAAVAVARSQTQRTNITRL